MVAVARKVRRTPAQRLRALRADARIQDFQDWCRSRGLPVPVAEYRWHPVRKWRHDFFFPENKIAIENQGGLFSGGRHARGAALLKEHEKLNDAARAGHRILFATPQSLKSREMLLLLREMLQVV